MVEGNWLFTSFKRVLLGTTTKNGKEDKFQFNMHLDWIMANSKSGMWQSKVESNTYFFKKYPATLHSTYTNLGKSIPTKRRGLVVVK